MLATAIISLAPPLPRGAGGVELSTVNNGDINRWDRAAMDVLGFTRSHSTQEVPEYPIIKPCQLTH
ncbi:MAG TPA: hypothetical protein V6C95_23965 [Coleofasciculaceae cyanobacterium]